MKNNSNKSAANLLACTWLLSLILLGCSQKPTSMIISPDARFTTSNIYQQLKAFVTVNDMRTAQHIIEITSDDKAAKLISNNNDLAAEFGKIYRKGLTDNGLVITTNGPHQINVTLNRAKISVAQSLSKYTSNSNITITVEMTVNDATMTKTFKSRANSTGILQADIAVLERDFNQQLGALLEQIVQDSELLTFINK